MSSSTLKAVSGKKPPVVDLFNEQSTSDMISSTHTEELVIALCGPIGSPLHSVGHAIRNLLIDSFGYDECTYLRLSDFIAQHASAVEMSVPEEPAFKRIESLINTGNKLRSKYGSGILAELAVHRIRLDRERHKGETQSPRYEPRRVCHIIDSVKNKEELALLKSVYRDMIYVVGVFAPLHLREHNLGKAQLSTPEIHTLIDRDSGEESASGQTVTDTFPQCDFFLRTDEGTDTQMKERVERFVHLILGTKVITPSVAETAMYSAAMASANSACLSRQVGATITDEHGDILSIGWNDVPKASGGLYGEDGKDHRCWNLEGGKCFNDDEKEKFAQELLSELSGVIPAENLPTARAILKKTGKLRSLIEFSRAIHAEMHAVLNAGKTAGMRMVNGKLFVTTYPCHSCARHLVAAGIKEVYYIEPYRKSLAIKLHGDAISEREFDVEKVRILAYEGVAPSRYLTLFKVPPNSRKRDGKMIIISLKDASPRLLKSMEAVPALEGLVVESLRKKDLLPLTATKNEDVPPPPSAA